MLLLLIKLEPYVKEAVRKARVARLATVDDKAQPYLVPVVFVFDHECFFIPLDKKRKKVKPAKLRRIKNIEKNPNVALLIDEYSDDWSKLFFVMVLGKASIIGVEQGELLTKVHKLLFRKYPQYKRVGLGESCIMIYPRKVIFWKNK